MTSDAPERAVREARLHRAVRPPASHALATGRAVGGGAAAAAALSRPLWAAGRAPRVQRPALLPHRPPGAWGDGVLLVREEGPAGRGPRPHAPRARAASAPAPAAPVLRRAP